MALPFLAGASSGLMAWFVKAFVFSVIADFIIKTLVGLGLVYVAYNMGDWSLNALFDAAQANVAQMPQDALKLFVKLGLNEVIDIIFTAFAVRIALDLMKNTKVLRMLSFGS